MTWVNIFDICKPKQWPTISIKDLKSSGFPVYGANGKIGFYSEYTHKKETVLITCRGATCGTINICEPKSYVNGNAMALDDLDQSKLDLRFLARFLNHRKLNDVISGSAQPQITRTGLRKIKIPLPPLATQKRIVELLDKAQALIDKRKEQIALMDQLIQSLFYDMFGDPVTNPKGWEVSELGTYIKKIVGGKSVGGEVRKLNKMEFGVLKISSVTSGVFDPDEYKVVSKAELPEELIHPQKGDLLFSRANTREMVGAVCVVDANYNKLFLPDKLWRIDLKKTQLTNWYVKYLLSHNGFRVNLKKVATGTSGSMLNISKAKLNKLCIPVPPLNLQNQFAERVQKIEAQKEAMTTSRKELENNFNSLMQRAFKGELV